jgi:hypothetical protein
VSNPPVINRWIDGSPFDAVDWSTTLTGVTAGHVLLITVCTSSAAYYSVPFTDNKGNTYTLINGGYTDPVGIAFFVCTVATGGDLVLTFQKQGATCYVGIIAREVSGLDTGLYDGAPVFRTATDAAPELVMTENSVPNDLLVCDYISFAPVTFGTPVAGWSQVESGTFGGGGIQMAGLEQFPNALNEDGFTAGWQSLTNSFTRRYYMGAIALIGVPVTPTVQGFSTPTPQNGGNLTVHGVYFGAPAGQALLIGDVTASITSWSDTDIECVCRLGKNQYLVPLKVQVITAAGVKSNRRPLTAMLPPTGRICVNVVEPYAIADQRLQAVTDAATGDQVEVDDVIDLQEDLRFSWTTATQASARLWSPGLGWGPWGVQSFSAGTVTTVLPVYPSTLPRLQVDEIDPAERAARTPFQSGPEVRRARSRDYHATLSAWTVLSRAELETFNTFGVTTCERWSGWFNASMPGRSGPLYRTFRFVDEPQLEYLGHGALGGLYRVTFQLEERGLGVT